MASYYRQKLIRIDEQILNLEYLYQRELQREQELGKHTLLLSRGIKYRLDNLYKARTILVKATGERNSKQATYAATLAERKNEYDEAVVELQILVTKREEAVRSALVNQSIVDAQESIDMGKEIISQRTRVRNKERALNNWIAKGGMIQTSERKLPKSYDAEEIATDINTAQERYQKHLDSLKPINVAVNQTTLDMLAKPEDVNEN